MKRVNRSHVYGQPRLAARVVTHDDAVIDAETVESLRHVMHEGAPVDQEDDGFAAFNGGMDDEGGQKPFARSGWRNEKHGAKNSERLADSL